MGGSGVIKESVEAMNILAVLQKEGKINLQENNQVDEDIQPQDLESKKESK